MEPLNEASAIFFGIVTKWLTCHHWHIGHMCHRNTVQGNMNGYRSDTNAGIIGTLGTIDTIMTLVTFMTFTGERLMWAKMKVSCPHVSACSANILAAGLMASSGQLCVSLEQPCLLSIKLISNFYNQISN